MRLRPFAALCLLVALPALAHDAPVPPTCLVAGTTPTIIGTFSFTPQQLATYRQQALAEGVCIEKDCGIVDEWYWATQMAKAYCATQQRSMRLSTDGVSFSVSQPVPYNSASHHKAYGFSSGNLTGACYVCSTSPGTPAPGVISNAPSS